MDRVTLARSQCVKRSAKFVLLSFLIDKFNWGLFDEDQTTAIDSLVCCLSLQTRLVKYNNEDSVGLARAGK
jgi:hypothetical protein